MLKNSKELVLVTGGAGFIGSHLVDRLIKSNYRVRVLDNLTPPTHNGTLPSWFNKKAEFIRGDVRRRADLAKALTGVDYIFHLAAYMDFRPDFSTYFATNTASTALIYEIIVEKKVPVKKIIVTSSQAVYGEGKYKCPVHGIIYPAGRAEDQLKKRQWEIICHRDGRVMKPLPEKEDDVPNPLIPYGISKLAAEKTALVLGKIYNIPSVAVRYSIVHGVRQSFRHFYSGALRVFSVQALSRQPLAIHEDGLQTRDFVNVKDVTTAHLKLLQSPRANYQSFNIGSGQVTKVIDLARAVAEAAGVSPNFLIDGEYRINTPRHQPMDVSKLKALGWRPRYSLMDNVREYINWVKNYPEAGEFLRRSQKSMKSEGIVKV